MSNYYYPCGKQIATRRAFGIISHPDGGEIKTPTYAYVKFHKPIIMLSKEDREKIRVSMLKKIDQTKSDILELEKTTQPIGPDNAIGRVSRIDAINNRSVNESILRETKVKLLRLEHALSIIDKSDFGICRRCGNIIPFGRLLLMPESTKCTSCA